MANERARGLGYKFVTDDKYLVDPFSPTDGISYEGDGSPVSYANSGIMSQAPAPLKYIPREGGGEGPVDTGPKDYGYKSSYASTGTTPGENKNYLNDIGVGTIDDEDDEETKGLSIMDMVRAGGAYMVGGPFNAISSLNKTNNRNKQKEIDKINEKINKQYGYNTQSNDGSGLNDGPDGGYTGSGNEGVSKSDPTHSDNYDMKNGGRAGYFFGGRVNYKAGGRTDAGPNRTTASKAGVGQINESGQKVSGGNYNNNGGGNDNNPPNFFVEDKTSIVDTSGLKSKSPEINVNYTDPRNYASLKGGIYNTNILDNDDINVDGTLSGEIGPVSYNTNFTDQGITNTNLTAGNFNADIDANKNYSLGYTNNYNGINYGAKYDNNGNLMFNAGVSFANGGLASIL